MPELSRFFGIVITMHYDDHARPHFHVRYQEHRAKFRIRDLVLYEGTLPPRIHGFVVEWSAIHQAELEEAWNLAELEQPLPAIKPLE